MLWGGAQVINQYLAAGLLDELELHVVPVLLAGGRARSRTWGPAASGSSRCAPSRRPA